MNSIDINPYLREMAFPTIWCPGCGHGIVMKAAIRAIHKMGWDKDEVIAVSGIGCSSRVPSYCDFYGIQTTHGRAIAFATGMKLNKPDMHVVLFLGDGDCSAIGGNHLIHAAKRNMNLTVIVMNNHIYGMTGGQTSPTTPYLSYTATSPYGNIEPELDICAVAQAAGASFVARTTAYHVPQMMSLIEKGFQNKGFSLIECIVPCPTSFGRRNKYKSAVSMYEHLRECAIPVDKAVSMTDEELDGKIVTGILKNKPRTDFNTEYKNLIARVAAKGIPEDSGLSVSNNKRKFNRTELRLTGSGGQGLITAGAILAEAAIRQGINAVHSQSYGPEARGGASRSDVILSGDEIYFPEVNDPGILLAMTQQSYDKYASSVIKGGTILVDSTFVKKVERKQDVRYYECPITELCIKNFGTAICANVVALGLLAALFDNMELSVFEEAVKDRVPKAFQEMNLSALRVGYHWIKDGQILTDAKK